MNVIVDPEKKILSLEQLVEYREALRRENKRFVLTNGCFDLLHRGHVSYLFESLKLGDFLAVAVNSDESVRRLKGEGRPVNHERDRAYVVASLACVGATTVFAGPRLAGEIRALRPDVYTKAGDYSIDRLEESERSALIDVRAQIVFTSFADGVSTTGLLGRIGRTTTVMSEVHGGSLDRPVLENEFQQ